MDLVPTPPQLIAAAGNVAHALLYGGLADLRPMPRTLIDEGTLREVYHYRPIAGVAAQGDPVLLVTPLAAPSICFDLRRGCSLVEHLVQGGRPTYLLEYGEVSFRDRNLGMEHWVDEVLPAAVRAVSEHAGGRPVHLVGWSLGGIFALLTAADEPDLPIASVVAVGSPFDVTRVPMMAPVRPLLNLTDGRGVLTRAYRAFGGVPKPIVRVAFQTASIHKVAMKPLAKLKNLDDREFLSQLEAVDRFSANMVAYPGRSFGQIYHRFVKRNALAGGSFVLGERTIDLAHLSAPVLVFGGANDGIAPIAAVKAVMPLLKGTSVARFEVVPGGHLGMLTGRGARTTMWRVLDDWVEEWSGSVAAPRTPAPKATAPRTPAKTAAARKAPAKKAPAKAVAKSTSAKKAPTRKAPAKQTVAKKAAPKKAPSAGTAATQRTRARTTAPDAASIGTNRTRRYGSADSRALSR